MDRIRARGEGEGGEQGLMCMFDSDETHLQRHRRQPHQHERSRTPSRPRVGGKVVRGRALEDGHLPPEPQTGHIEYKLSLADKSHERFQHLVTQMKWRLQEGHGKAVYEIGVRDDGIVEGLDDEEMAASLETLEAMAATLDADITIVRRPATSDPTKSAAHVEISFIRTSRPFMDVRVAVLGPVDAGKSTLVGVLTSGELDNGRGKARLNLFRHSHEILSGRTSSVSQECLAFDGHGEVLNYDKSGILTSIEELSDRAAKVIYFTDSPGHEKYLKTTLFGLSCRPLDCAMLVISATSGIVGTTKEHLDVAIAMDVPVFVVITKIDKCSREELGTTLNALLPLLSGPSPSSRTPFIVRTDNDVVTAARKMSKEFIPVLLVSSVAGKNLDKLRSFLQQVTPLEGGDVCCESCNHAELQVEDTFDVQGVGPIVAGHVLRGKISCGDKMLLGPDSGGRFIPVVVESIHRNKISYKDVRANQLASCALVGVTKNDVRRGQVLCSPDVPVFACLEFDAEVEVMDTKTPISPKFQGTAFVDSVRQTCRILALSKESLGISEQASARMQFIGRPEYVRIGARVLIVEGGVKIVGTVSKTYPMAPSE